jgi:hypothetical protein
MSIITMMGILIAVLFLLVIGNFVFSVVAERKHPPVGSFIECDGVRCTIWSGEMRPPRAWSCFTAMGR